MAGDFSGDGRDDLGALDHRSDGTVRTVTWTATPSASFNPGIVGWTITSKDWLYNNTRLFNSYN